MSTRTAAEAMQELKESGLLTSDHLLISVYAKLGDLGRLRIDIENGRNSLSPGGKEEKRYLEIVEHLPNDDVVALCDMLRTFYIKSV